MHITTTLTEINRIEEGVSFKVELPKPTTYILGNRALKTVPTLTYTTMLKTDIKDIDQDLMKVLVSNIYEHVPIGNCVDNNCELQTEAQSELEEAYPYIEKEDIEKLVAGTMHSLGGKGNYISLLTNTHGYLYIKVYCGVRGFDERVKKYFPNQSRAQEFNHSKLMASVASFNRILICTSVMEALEELFPTHTVTAVWVNVGTDTTLGE